MNLRDLKYLVAVADLRHFGRAADACFVSQPTLSTQIRKLEEFLGVTLIERNNRQVLLTATGEKIVARARIVLREADQLVRLARQASDPLGGEFRLGVIPTVAPYLLPRMLPALRTRFPELEVQLVEAQTSVITRELRLGHLDAIILALPLLEEGVRSEGLYDEPFYLAVPESDPLARQAAVRAEDLAHRQVLLLEDGHCLRDQALDVCTQVGAVENLNFSATSIETLRHMVVAGIGVTLIPELARQDSDGMRYVPFEGAGPQRRIGLAWRSTSTRELLLGPLGELVRVAVSASLGPADRCRVL
jgi:LysR family hydrogen peroxide-inducible transcriptional activator